MVNGTLTVEGSLTANGDDGQAYSGGGSGGSIYLAVGTLAGSGVVSASGGGGYGGGGGGRIAIYYHTKSLTGVLSACGGSRGIPGGAGTIFTKCSGEDFADLLIDNGGHSGAMTPVLYAGPFDAIEVINGGKLDLTSLESVTTNELSITDGSLVHVPSLLIANSLELGSGARINHPAGQVAVMDLGGELVIDDGASITACIDLRLPGDLTIGSAGSISAGGKGYRPGSGPGRQRISPGKWAGCRCRWPTSRRWCWLWWYWWSCWKRRSSIRFHDSAAGPGQRRR
jgi:hypothetical protein